MYHVPSWFIELNLIFSDHVFFWRFLFESAFLILDLFSK
jgi:hypothetical protein